MKALGSKYQQLGLPSAERLALPEFATDKNEFAKAKKMLLTAIGKQLKKGGPCYSALLQSRGYSGLCTK